MEQAPYARLELFWLFKGLRNMSAFAEATGISPGTLSAIKNRKSMPSPAVMEAILKAYPDISTDYILWGREPMLRDGRTLTPIPAQQPDYTSGQGIVNTVVETLLRDRLADKQVIIDMLTAEVAELRGKPFDSPDAADELPVDPNAPTFSGDSAPNPHLRGGRRLGFQQQRAAELS